MGSRANYLEKFIVVILILLYCNSINVFAQTLSINGNIANKNGSYLSFCNIVLKSDEYKFIKGTISDDIGSYEFRNLNSGSYYIIFSSIGYKTDSIFIEKLITNINIGNFYLEENTTSLEEVTITARHVINKDGIKYILPTIKQIEKSTNGMSLLDQMNLPQLNIDAVSNSIMVSGGGKVQLRINGRLADKEEVLALVPENIIRIEYHDKPEAKYNYAAVVLDYIVKHHESGGNIYGELWHSSGFGEDYFFAKVNKKKSAISAYYSLSYRNWENHRRENTELFKMIDKEIQRNEVGKPADFKYDIHKTNLNYSYVNDKKIFNLSAKIELNNQPANNWNSELYSSNTTDATSMIDNTESDFTYYQLNVYYQHPINEKSTFYLSSFGSYNVGDYNRFYRELRNQITKTEINTFVDEDQWKTGTSILFENKAKFGTLQLGIDEKYSFTENNYLNVYESIKNKTKSDVTVNNLYAFIQFGKAIKKWYIRPAIGINSNVQNTNGSKNHNLTFRPSLFIGYEMNDNWTFRYIGSTRNNNPNIYDLTDYTQYIDSIQVRKGNPNLKPETEYYNALVASFNKGKYGFSYYLNHTLKTNPLMELTDLKNNIVVRTIDNHKKFHRIGNELEFRAKPTDWVRIKLYSGVKYHISNGNDYSHSNMVFYYGSNLKFYYKKFTLSWLMNQNTFDNYIGETLSRGESAHMLALSYKHNNLFLSIDAINLFSTKHIGSRENNNDISPYKRYEYLDELKNLVRFKVSYRFKYGKDYNSGRQKIRATDDKKSGILKGEK